MALVLVVSVQKVLEAFHESVNVRTAALTFSSADLQLRSPSLGIDLRSHEDLALNFQLFRLSRADTAVGWMTWEFPGVNGVQVLSF